MSLETVVLWSGGLGTGAGPATVMTPKGGLEVHIVDEDPNKEMSVPIAHYAAMECVGLANRLVILTPEWGKDQLDRFFSREIPNDVVTTAKRLGKTSFLEAEDERRQAYSAQIEYIVQPPEEYGTNYAMKRAQEVLKGEKMFGAMAVDYMLLQPRGVTSEYSKGLSEWAKSSAASAYIMGFLVDRNLSPTVGVLNINENGMLGGFDEKPSVESLPSDQLLIPANASRYGFVDEVWEQIDEEMQDPMDSDGESRITNTFLRLLMAGKKVKAHEVNPESTGVRQFDAGRPRGLRSVGDFLTENPEYR